jgi:hypothetical protein
LSFVVVDVDVDVDSVDVDSVDVDVDSVDAKKSKVNAPSPRHGGGRMTTTSSSSFPGSTPKRSPRSQEVIPTSSYFYRSIELVIVVVKEHGLLRHVSVSERVKNT